jgi:hypothetical protein
LKRPEGRAPEDLLPSAARFWFSVRVPFNQNQSMKIFTKTLALAAFALAIVGTVRAEESITGTWKGEFDSQVGLQKYTYVLKADGTNLTGRAVGVRDTGTNDVAITEGKINKDQISFVEPLKFDDNDIRIEYTGSFTNGEIKLHRKVGDFGEEDLVAKRSNETDVKSETTADTNSPPANP